MNNSRPTYTLDEFCTTTGKVVLGKFKVYEYQNGVTNLICSLQYNQSTFERLIQRGIPLTDAIRLTQDMKDWKY